MAGLIYGETITDPKDPRRQAGKVAELQLGFGSGWRRLQSSARNQWGVVLTDDESQRAVVAYRQSHRAVSDGLWKAGGWALERLADGGRYEWRKGLVIRDGRLYHPNGTWLDYSRLKWSEGEWRLYGRGGSWRKMYGAKLVENVVQWLSRIVTAEAMVKFDRAGYQVVGTSHDDIWLLVPDDQVKSGWFDDPFYRKTLVDHRVAIISIMSETPAWAPGLPLAADCKLGRTYGG
jgi:DNA polymerase bacteriophage-type